nr:probable RNA-dependent RNA polymerase 1 [Ipomoea batatas]
MNDSSTTAHTIAGRRHGETPPLKTSTEENHRCCRRMDCCRLEWWSTVAVAVVWFDTVVAKVASVETGNRWWNAVRSDGGRELKFLVSRDGDKEAKTCIEKHTGAGSVSAVEVKKCRTGQRSYAKVQFGNNRIADQIISLANNRKLYFGTSYLKAFEMDTRIVQDRSYIHEMETLTLYFGCQTSKERFYSIWRGGIVSIKFGYGLKKMHLFLSYLSTEYKLQLSYEHIWEIKLYRPHHRNVKFLVIQVLCFSYLLLHGSTRKQKTPFITSIAITPDEQWVRTTDFTRKLHRTIFRVCVLEIPAGVNTYQKFRDHFVYYTAKLILKFSVESWVTRFFLTNLDLVPILAGSPREVNLAFPKHEIEMISRHNDSKGQGTEYNFSDGIGKISADFARRVAMPYKCGLEDFAPSAYQNPLWWIQGITVSLLLILVSSKKFVIEKIA